MSNQRRFLQSGDINREKTCPLLLRVFYKIGSHHRPEEFNIRGKEPSDEVQIYTWRDVTLRELTDLIKGVHSAARQRNAILSFALVYPDKLYFLKGDVKFHRLGKMVFREIGKCSSTPKREKDPQEFKTLDELRFDIGDFLDVAIYVNGVPESHLNTVQM